MIFFFLISYFFFNYLRIDVIYTLYALRGRPTHFSKNININLNLNLKKFVFTQYLFRL